MNPNHGFSDAVRTIKSWVISVVGGLNQAQYNVLLYCSIIFCHVSCKLQLQPIFSLLQLVCPIIFDL